MTPPTLILQPRRGLATIDWRELLAHRELLYFLVWRDVKVRYKQTVLGLAWAVLQPLLSVAIFTLIFGRFAGLADGLPPAAQGAYASYVYAGMLPWLLFSTGLTGGGLSLVNQQQLLTKVYFPRLFIPTAICGAALVDLAISLAVFGGLLAVQGVVPSWQIVLLPGIIALVVCATVGIACLLSAATVMYRDFRFLIPFMSQIWMYLSFVAYPSTLAPEKWQRLLAINPMFGLIDACRSAVFGVPWRLDLLAISATTAVLLLAAGVFYFRHAERKLADIA